MPTERESQRSSKSSGAINDEVAPQSRRRGRSIRRAIDPANPILLAALALISFMIAFYAMQTMGRERATEPGDPASPTTIPADKIGSSDQLAPVRERGLQALAYDLPERDEISELTFRISQEALAQRVISAGDQIKLLAISKGPRSHVAYESVLSNIRVLAVDPASHDLDKAANLGTVSLQMTSRQATIASYAAETGSVRLIDWQDFK